jgi:hypothetical protein
MKKVIVFALLSLPSAFAQAKSTIDVVCSYAPSQSDVVKNISASAGAAGGAGATALAIAQATGLTAVAHSSGAYIFTGSSGYVAGTLGGTAAATAAAPVIIGVSITVGTAVGAVELLCTPKNHPEFTAKVMQASEEFVRRSKTHLNSASDKITKAKENAKPAISKITVVFKDSASNVFNYAYRTAINSEFK